MAVSLMQHIASLICSNEIVTIPAISLKVNASLKVQYAKGLTSSFAVMRNAVTMLEGFPISSQEQMAAGRGEYIS